MGILVSLLDFLMRHTIEGAVSPLLAPGKAITIQINRLMRCNIAQYRFNKETAI
jgi:hypothetical protein